MISSEQKTGHRLSCLMPSWLSQPPQFHLVSPLPWIGFGWMNAWHSFSFPHRVLWVLLCFFSWPILLQVSAWVMYRPLALYCHSTQGFPFCGTYYKCNYLSAKDRNWLSMSPAISSEFTAMSNEHTVNEHSINICLMNVSLNWNTCLCWWHWPEKKVMDSSFLKYILILGNM